MKMRCTDAGARSSARRASSRRSSWGCASPPWPLARSASPVGACYPHVVVPDLTLTNTATVPSTLYALQSALAVGAVVLFPAFGYLFYVFKRRQTLPPHGGASV